MKPASSPLQRASRRARDIVPGLALTLAAALALASSAAPAQESWPAKPVRIIAPFGAGGGGDVSLRMLSQHLARALGQSIVVDNKPGASGIIGVQEALKAPADDYTLFYGSTTTLAANSSTLKKIPYDPVADFRSITLVSWIPYMLVIAPTNSATSVAQLIAQAKAAQRPLTYASSNDTGLVAGFEPKTATPEATDAFVRAERDKWAQRVKAAGIEPQ